MGILSAFKLTFHLPGLQGEGASLGRAGAGTQCDPRPCASTQVRHVPPGQSSSPGPPEPAWRRHPRGHLCHPLQGTGLSSGGVPICPREGAGGARLALDLSRFGLQCPQRGGGTWVGHTPRDDGHWPPAARGPPLPCASPPALRGQLGRPFPAAGLKVKGCLVHCPHVGMAVFSGVRGSLPL